MCLTILSRSVIAYCFGQYKIHSQINTYQFIQTPSSSLPTPPDQIIECPLLLLIMEQPSFMNHISNQPTRFFPSPSGESFRMIKKRAEKPTAHKMLYVFSKQSLGRAPMWKEAEKTLKSAASQILIFKLIGSKGFFSPYRSLCWSEFEF